MPRMDGMETLRRLRQKSDMPVIFLTSKDEEIDELFGPQDGSDDSSENRSRAAACWLSTSKAVLRRYACKDRTETRGRTIHRFPRPWRSGKSPHIGFLSQTTQRLHAVHARHLDI